MAATPQTGPQDRPGRWRIDRFEFIYYNARHKRWQYFAEDPLVPFNEDKSQRRGESPHRRQVRRFLFMVREAIERLVSEVKPGCFEVRPRRGGTPNHAITIERPTFSDWQISWNDYLGYLFDSAKSGERLPTVDVEALERCFADLSTSGLGAHTLSRNLSITLLSLLPILEDWDTWGCFLRARKAAIQEHPNEMHFPSCCADADWFEPFYIAEVEYTGASTQTVSAQLLGEDVNLEAGCSDLAARKPRFRMSDRADFFQYCRRPEERDGELYLYRCYGHFVDTLIKGLSGEGDQRRFFFLAYPLQAAGRLHYLQIALTTTDADASVSTLYDDWTDIHRDFWQPECRSMLAAEQERIALSAFQHAAAARLREFAERDGKLTDAILKTVLAENIYSLFPIRFVKTDHASWHYVPYTYEETLHPDGKMTQVGIRDCVLGYRWRLQDAGSPPQYAGTAEENLIAFKAASCAIEGKAPRIGNHVLQRTIIVQRIVQSIEQQMDYLESMQHAIEQERRIQMEHARRAGLILVQFLETLSAKDRQRVLTAATLNDVQYLLSTEVEEGRYGVEEPSVPFGFTDHPRRAMRYLHQAHPTATSGDRLEVLRRALQPSLLEDLSCFLDSSLIKIYTHTCDTSDYFSGTLDDARRAVADDGFLGRHASKLSQRIALVDPNLKPQFDQAYARFAAIVQTRITELSELANWESSHKAEFKPWDHTMAKVRGKLECRSGPPIAEGATPPRTKRYFLPWSLWLQKWVDAYQQSRIRDGVSPEQGPHVVETRAIVAGERFPLAGAHPVHLYDNSWWFACSVGADVPLGENANVMINWKEACQECATLCLVNTDSDNTIVSIRESLCLEDCTTLVTVGAAARSRAVVSEHFGYIPKAEGANYWVVIYQSWRADERIEAA